MVWKQTGQLGLADALATQHKALEELDDLHDLIDWKRIEPLLHHVHSSVKGEPAWHPVIMFKVLLLQKIYNLSDPRMEKQLARDLLFRRFVGLSLTDDTPDHSTIWRFHKKLADEQLADKLFQEIFTQLEQQNIIIKQGSVSIIDATVVEAKNKRPKKDKNNPDNEHNTQDKDASYNIKKDANGVRKTTYGFKIHANSDEDGFVKKVKTTTGSTHDSQVFEQLLTNEESAVYADSAYKSQQHDDLLKQKNINNQIHERAYRNKPLTKAQKRNNTQKSQIRNTVERVFGHFKLHYGMTKARHLGLTQFHTNTVLTCIVHNLKTAVSIKRTYGIVG